MEPGSRAVFFVAVSAALTGMLYFLGLALGLPFWCCVALVVAAVSVAGWRLFRQSVMVDNQPVRRVILQYSILLLGVTLIINRTHYLTGKYGGWDAWGIWNHAGRMLTWPQYWKHTFDVIGYSHPDYPLGLPGLVAFGWLLCGTHFNVLVPFAIGLLPTLLIPVLIFTETARKHLALATIALLWFATDDSYLLQGVQQMADTWVALFLLCAVVCVRRDSGGRRNVLLAAFFAGCGAWFKNEGLLLAGLFLLFYLKTILSKENRKAAIYGLLLPVVCIVLFKIGYAPANDLVNGGMKQQLPHFLDAARYGLIKKWLSAYLQERFYVPMLVFFLYLVLCVAQRRWPARVMWLLLTCLVAYELIYLISPYDLEWHLATSQDRLLHQLLPAFVYAMLLRFEATRVMYVAEGQDAPKQL